MPIGHYDDNTAIMSENPTNYSFFLEEISTSVQLSVDSCLLLVICNYPKIKNQQSKIINKSTFTI